MFIIKFFITFSFSYLILNIPILNKTVFDHLNYFTDEYTQQLYSHAGNLTKKSIYLSKKFSKKLFTNSNPEDDDNIVSKLGRDSKTPKQYKVFNSKTFNPHDSYTAEEEELLRKLIKKAQ